MKVRLLNQLGLTRRLRQFLVLFTLLLMPLGAWADYELAIQYGTDESNYHSVSVPNDATDVLGDGTITYDSDTHVLTLNGVNVTCSYNSYSFIVNGGYWDAEQELTVRLVGSNTITLGNGSSFYDGKGITFITGEGNSGSLTIVKESGWNGILFKDGSTEITPTCEDGLTYNSSTSEITLAEDHYSLWICGTQVTDANKDDILNDGKWSFQPIEGAWQINQLTFSGVTIENYEGNAINSGIDVTIVVAGTNTISCAEGYYPFYSTNGAQFDFDANNEGTLTGTNMKPFSDNCDYHFGEKGSDPNITGPTLYFTQNGYTIAPGTNHWDVSINSNALYSQNYDDVFGDGTVSASDNPDTETFTITLNEANFKGPLCTEAYGNVVVNLTGVNYIKNTDEYKKPFSRSYGEDYTLTFTGDGELRLIDANITSADDAFANNTNTFNDIDCSANFTTGGWSKEYVTPATGDPYLRIYKAPISYNLTVGGIPVTSANANDVLGDGTDTSNPTVTYDTENNTLNLENATINGDIIYTADNDNSFWINLYGTNSVSRITYTGQQEVDLFVCRAETNVVSHSLTVTGNGTDAAISGFHNIDEVNNEYYDIELRLYWKPTITNNVMTSLIITSNIFGGTGTESSPYIISTPTQLETFATLYNASELVSDCYVELGDDINCAGLQGFEPIGTPEMPFIGHFDGASHKISNLLYETGSEDDYAGLFRKVGDDDDEEPAPGYVSNLTLENCTFRNGNMYNGAIAGLLNKGTIDNCTVTSCSILNETSAPSSGGIVGGQSGGSITNCIVSGSTIAATSTTGGLAGGIVAYIMGSATVSGCQVTGTDEKPTTITCSSNYYDSGINFTGGIVGNCSDFNYDVISISNNKVSGNTTISSIDNEGGDNTCAGAIVGNKGNASFSNNYYYYTVTTSTKNGEAEVVERSGYQQRGTGYSSYDEQLQVVTEDYDIVTDNGAMLYTKLVTFNIDTHCGMECDWGYELLSEPDNRLYYFAPGQPIIVNLYPDDGYIIEAVTLTYTAEGATAATVETLENDDSGNDEMNYTYTFTMPDAPASFDVTVNQALDIEFVDDNSWASYYATENLTVPTGLTAYVVSDVDEESGAVTVTSIGYIPKNNAVLLEREQNGAASGYTAGAYTGTTTTVNNLLSGSPNTTDISSLGSGPVYVLFNDKFKRAISGTIPARRAYLALDAAVAPVSAPQYLTINIVDGNSTAIDTLTVDDSSNESWYTIDGLKLNGKPQRKGLYINNGKKVYINNNK